MRKWELQLLYLHSILQCVVSWQLTERRVSPVIDTQVQVFVEHPEVFVRSFYQPASTLTKRKRERKKLSFRVRKKIEK